MERLTKRVGDNITYNKEKKIECNVYCNECFNVRCKTVKEMLRKLADYEDAEEQGLFVKLPCKVGTHIFINGVLGVGEAEEYKVIKVDYHSTLGTGRNEFYIEALLVNDPKNSIGFYDDNFGKTVFLSKEEAERALKKMESEE